MISNRTRNSEYVKDANPYGYHLGQGILYLHASGHEFVNLYGAWDWNLVPGTTTLLNHSRLDPANESYIGLRSFVGSVSDGMNGFSAMDYLDPQDQSLAYRKTWFFINDTIIVSVINATSTNNSISNPIVTVLNQRLATDDPILVNNTEVSSGEYSAKTLFNGGNGYLAFQDAFQLTVTSWAQTGYWLDICNISEPGLQNKDTQNIFTAYLTHESSISYAIYPATEAGIVQQESECPSIQPLNSTSVTGASGNGYIALAFWPNASLSTTVSVAESGWNRIGDFEISASDPSLLLISNENGSLNVSVADPTQNVSSIEITFLASEGNLSCAEAQGCHGGGAGNLTLTYDLPLGGSGGQTVTKQIQNEPRK